jgi:hypothetical protein
MKKFKLIKEYPGSPKLGTEVERISKSSKNYSYSEEGRLFCVLSQHVEENSEYWKEVNEHVWYVVFKEDYNFFDAWHPYCLETCTEYENRFKTIEQAEAFVLYNKPCLSFNDVRKAISNLGISEGSVDYALESVINLAKVKL